MITKIQVDYYEVSVASNSLNVDSVFVVVLDVDLSAEPVGRVAFGPIALVALSRPEHHLERLVVLQATREHVEPSHAGVVAHQVEERQAMIRVGRQLRRGQHGRVIVSCRLLGVCCCVSTCVI